jgi:hypothetical protein
LRSAVWVPQPVFGQARPFLRAALAALWLSLAFSFLLWCADSGGVFGHTFAPPGRASFCFLSCCCVSSRPRLGYIARGLAGPPAGSIGLPAKTTAQPTPEPQPTLSIRDKLLCTGYSNATEPYQLNWYYPTDQVRYFSLTPHLACQFITGHHLEANWPGSGEPPFHGLIATTIKDLQKFKLEFGDQVIRQSGLGPLTEYTIIQSDADITQAHGGWAPIEPWSGQKLLLTVSKKTGKGAIIWHTQALERKGRAVWECPHTDTAVLTPETDLSEVEPDGISAAGFQCQ